MMEPSQHGGSGRGKKAQAVWFPDGFDMGYEKKNN